MAQQILSRQYMIQARQLAQLDPTRPQQGSLRRAVSTAYYALFHFLVEEANCFLLGTTAARAAMRNVLARAFAHTEMAAASRTFGGGNLPASLVQRLGGLPIPSALQQLARTFVDAQERRHVADYDPGETFTRSAVQLFIDNVQGAIRDDPATEFFLLSLLVWNRVRDR